MFFWPATIQYSTWKFCMTKSADLDLCRSFFRNQFEFVEAEICRFFMLQLTRNTLYFHPFFSCLCGPEISFHQIPFSIFPSWSSEVRTSSQADSFFFTTKMEKRKAKANKKKPRGFKYRRESGGLGDGGMKGGRVNWGWGEDGGGGWETEAKIIAIAILDKPTDQRMDEPTDG